LLFWQTDLGVIRRMWKFSAPQESIYWNGWVGGTATSLSSEFHGPCRWRL